MYKALALLFVLLAGTTQPLWGKSFFSRPKEFSAAESDPGERTRKQNKWARAQGDSPVESDDDIIRLFEQGKLVLMLEGGVGYTLDPKMGKGYHTPKRLWVARPQVPRFTECAGLAFAREFGELETIIEDGQLFFVDQVQIAELLGSSLIRTPKRQCQIEGTKDPGNAASCVCETLDCSSHLTGATIDFSKLPMSPQQIRWFRGYLYPLHMNGWIDVVEEVSGNANAFHIFVDRDYPGCAEAFATHAPKRSFD